MTVGEIARAEAEDFGSAVEKVDERLRDSLQRTPLLDNLLDWRLVLLAAAVGLIVGGIARLIVPWLAAVVIFLIVFITVMLVIAGRRTGD